MCICKVSFIDPRIKYCDIIHLFLSLICYKNVLLRNPSLIFPQSVILCFSAHRGPQFSNLLDVISDHGGSQSSRQRLAHLNQASAAIAVPLPADNPRAGRNGKTRRPSIGLVRHPTSLRHSTGQNLLPSNGGNFLSSNKLSSRNIAFPSNGGVGDSSSKKIPWQSDTSDGGGFRPSFQLPPDFVTVTRRPKTLSSITGSPPLIASGLVNSNSALGGRLSSFGSSFASATVTGRPPSTFKNSLITNSFSKPQQLQSNLIPIGAGASSNKNNANSFSDNIITDDKPAFRSFKNLDSKFKKFEAINFFDPSQPNSEIIIGVPNPSLESPTKTSEMPPESIFGGTVLRNVDELDASPSSPSLITVSNVSPQVSTPRMFTELMDIISVSTSRPPAFDGVQFVKEIGPYPDVFATSPPPPSSPPFPIQNNNQQLIFSSQSQQSNFQNTDTFQNTLDDAPSSAVSGPNPSSFNTPTNTRFPIEAFRGAGSNTINQQQTEIEPLPEDLLNLVNSLRGRIKNGENNQQPRRPKNQLINPFKSGDKRKKNKTKTRKQKAERPRSGKQQNNINNAISSLNGILGRQAQRFGPNSAGPVVEGFPAGLPAATPEGVKIALSSPLGEYA